MLFISEIYSEKLISGKARSRIRPLENYKTTIPSNWQSHTIFISEPGLYALITRSKKPEAIQFTRWVYEEVLPSLRLTGKYRKQCAEKDLQLVKLSEGLLRASEGLLEANKSLDIARLDAETARKDMVVLSHRLADIAQDVIAKPQGSRCLHTLSLHKIRDNEFKFTRCQRK